MSEGVDAQPGVTIDQGEVLPETLEYCLDLGRDYLEARDIFGRSLEGELKSYEWRAAEVRGKNLPSINIYHTGETVPSEVIDKVLEKYERVRDILGYEEGNLPAFSVFIDPSAIGYAEAAGAFADSRENMIWVKSKGLGLAHEITHLMTAFNPCYDSDFLREGICAFVEWRAKTTEERKRDFVDDYELIARQFIHDPQVADEIGKEGIDVDFPKEELMAAKIFGGLFFHTLVEDFGLTTQQIGRHWKETTRFENVSGWVESMGLDPKKVASVWMKRIKSPLPGLALGSRSVEHTLRFFAEIWRTRLGLA